MDKVAIAQQYKDAGFVPVPLLPLEKAVANKLSGTTPNTSKAPYMSQWQRNFVGPGYWHESAYPNDGIGLVQGEHTGTFCADFDKKDGGLVTLKDFEAAHGQFPETVRSNTGGGGVHLFFKYPDDARILSKDKTFQGVDIKAGYIDDDGMVKSVGQVAEYPTEHESGTGTQWAEGHAPGEIEVADAPQWFIDQIVAAQMETWEVHSEPLRTSDGLISYGARHDAFKTEGARLHNLGYSMETLERMLMVYYETACEHLDTDNINEVEAGIHDVAKWFEGKDIDPNFGHVTPADLPEVPKFPTDIFPDDLAELVRNVAETISGPEDFPSSAVMAVGGLGVGSTRRLAPPGLSNWEEPTILWNNLVCPSGSGKTPGQTPILGPIIAIHKEWKEIYEEEWKQYEEDQAIWKSITLPHWKKNCEDIRKANNKPGAVQQDMPDYPDGEPKKPIRKKTHTSNVTVEKLIDETNANERGIMVHVDELAGLLTGMNQYHSGGGGNERQLFLMFYNGFAEKNRVDDAKSVEPEYPHIMILGTMQPGALGHLVHEKEIDDGFIGRWLFYYPTTPKVTYPGCDIDLDLLERWDDAVRRLYTLDFERAVDGSIVGPKVLTMDNEAHAEFRNFYDSHWAEYNAMDEDGVFRAPWAKLSKTWTRVALIIHYLRWSYGESVSPTRIDGITAIRASRLIAYFKAHTKKTYVKMGSSKDARAIPCDWCEEMFAPRNPNHRYCSDAHKQAAYRERRGA